MMLCVDNEMLHESLPDHEFGPLGTGTETGSHNGREHRHAAHADPLPTSGQHRHEVLTRVVRISEALNQRLAL
jgi:hypothetical protein